MHVFQAGLNERMFWNVLGHSSYFLKETPGATFTLDQAPYQWPPEFPTSVLHPLCEWLKTQSSLIKCPSDAEMELGV